MGVIYTILLGTAYSLLINFVIIVPMYWGLANNTYGNFFGNYSDMSSSFLKYEFSWFITGLVFNPIKLNIIFWMSMGLWKALVDSLNMENYIKDPNKEDDLE